ncbi:MAG: helix-turn-helix domain-containing protein [Chloroflexota bacterium]
MPQAYSRLQFLLEEHSLTRADLQRRLAAEDSTVNVKTLYRLADPDRPLERIDLRVVGAICRTLEVKLDDLVVFADPTTMIETLPEHQQRRLDELMEQHNEGELSPAGLEELQMLVHQAEQIALANARRLAEHRRRIRRATQKSANILVGRDR